MKPGLPEIKETCQGVLNSLLLQVRKDIEDLTAVGGLFTPRGTVDIEILEDYLYHVNSFYYRTFDQKMVPAYLEKVNRAVAEIYQVGRNGEQVRNDIASNLARCAGLYNLLKQLTRALSDAEQVVEKDVKVMTERHIGINGQVREIIGDVMFEIRSVEELFNDLEKLGETGEWSQLDEGDLQLLQAIGLYEQAWTGEANAKLRDELGRWLAQAETLTQRLEKAAQPSGERGTSENWAALGAETLRVGKVPGFSMPLAAPVRERLGAWMELEVEKATFYEGQGLSDRAGEQWEKFAVEAKKRLEQWVRVFRELLRLSREGLDYRILSEVRSLAPAAGDHARAIARLLREFQRELKALSDKLERYPDTGPLELQKFLEEAFHRYAREFRDRWAKASVSEMTSLGFRVKYALEYLELIDVKLGYHRERLEINLEQRERYRRLLEELRGFRQLFSGFKKDLENLMSPGTLKRVWRDLAVEVKHYPVKAGMPLPPECLPVLDRGLVELRPVPEKEHLVVLEEKGDLFWIQVDGVERWEVPYLVVGVKGR